MCSHQNNYLISAIVSVYNCERFIKGCIEDLLNQTIATRVEIVIINSGSQQNEEAIIKHYQKKHPNILYLKTEQRETIYAAWNRAIKISSGKYITNANSDDRHRKDAFEIMSRVLDNNSDIDVVYPSYKIAEKENETFENSKSEEYYDSPAYDRRRMLFQCLPGPFPMWRKSIHEIFGYFDQCYQVAGDHEFWLRISKSCNLYNINEYLGLYYRNPKGGEFREPVLTKKEAVKLTNSYIESEFIPENCNNIELIKDIKKRQSDFLFRSADFFFFQNEHELARKYALKSIACKGNYFNNIKLITYCMLPQRYFEKILWIKKMVGRETR